MDLTAFNSRIGISQGRIPLDNTDFVFVLGDDVPGYFHNLEGGDHAQVVQDLDLTDVNIVQTELTVKVPDSTPETIGFELVVPTLMNEAIVLGLLPPHETGRLGHMMNFK